MKIAFLCTSLAPGRDGVGDYVLQLAAACADQGHVCLLVALHDRHLAAPAALVQRAGEVRLSAALGWTRRAAMLADLLRDFEPHWVSWQLVPYGFHPKGILPTRCFALAQAAQRWPNHVMLHELWLGLAQRDRFRSHLVGALQRRQLLSFLRRLKPVCVHTTNRTYQAALGHWGWSAEVLPLFGNMPVLPVKPYVAQAELTDLVGPALPAEPRWLGALFGTIHPQWQPKPTLDFLQAAATGANRRIGLIAVGRPGAHGARLLHDFAHARPAVRIFSAGPQAPEKISHLLQAVDFGLATHPWALIEKSGSTATLLEHGLPVLVPRDDWQPSFGAVSNSHDTLLRRMHELTPDAFGAWLGSRREPAASLPGLAAKFIAALDGPAPRGVLVA